MAAGMYVDVPPPNLPHPHYYYFRGVRPWTRADVPSPDALGQYLENPRDARPVLVWEPTYLQYRRARINSGAPHGHLSPAMLIVKDIVDDVFVLLPVPYEGCADEANRRGPG